jgi:phosphatidylserine decarboxylase
MSFKNRIQAWLAQEDLNFVLTNRLPRNAVTRAMGWFSQIEQPWVRDASIATWKFFSDLDLSDAAKTEFKSMHDCFIRDLKPGARTIDPTPGVLTSPVDGIVGEHGTIVENQLFQAKGLPYTLDELLGPSEDTKPWQSGSYITLRLTSSMYHHFHAPYDCTIEKVRYFSGDTWNVNPIALKRVRGLFCKNERAMIQARLGGPGPEAGQRIALVPVAAILVASIRLHCLDVLFHLRYKGPAVAHCDAAYAKGQELGWFQHGSTVILLAPPGFVWAEGVALGEQVRLGQPLMRWSGQAQ